MSQVTLFPLPLAKRPAQLRYKKDPNKKVNNLRYYYHRRLKGKYEIDGVLRTIKVSFSCFQEIPTPDRYYIGQLISMGYNMQFNLL